MGIKHLFFAAALFLALTVSADASCGSRGFGSTAGSASTDKIQTGFSTVTAAQRSYSVWIWIDTTLCAGGGGSGYGRIFDSGDNDYLYCSTSGPQGLVYKKLTSGTAGEWSLNTGVPSAGAWHNWVVTLDASSTSNSPLMYLDGTSISVYTTTAPTGTYTTTAANYYVGNRSDGTRNFDGRISDIAIWNSILTANDARALGQGASPLRIQPANLAFYDPMCGGGSGEADWGPSHVSNTLTGTAAQGGPPTEAYPFMGNN
jgi:hypothetical protein